MKLRAIVIGTALCAAAWAQIDKPSPVPSRNKKQATETTPQTTPAPKAAPKKEGAPAPGGEADRTTSPSGPNLGTACYFRPKGDGKSTNLRTAAHPDLPLGTKVKVTNLANNKVVTVVITGHGDLAGRIISVSRDAAEELDFVRAGTAQVRIEALKN